jgi:hypothetical protein
MVYVYQLPPKRGAPAAAGPSSEAAYLQGIDASEIIDAVRLRRLIR